MASDARAAALAAILADAAAGRFPPADGNVTILPQPSARDCGVLSFTAHAVIFANADPAWVESQLPPGDLSGPLSASFLTSLAGKTGRIPGNIDVLTCATPLPGPVPIRLRPQPSGQHSRAVRALRYRDDIRVWQTDGAVLILGRGLAGRCEVAIEVDPDRRGQGLGRALAAAARHVVPDGAALWAQIAPGNAASVRAFLAAGYRPVGAEILLTRGLPAEAGQAQSSEVRRGTA